MKPLTALLALALLTSGCTVGPNYKKPAVDIPGQYRGTAPSPETPASSSQPGQEQPQQALAHNEIGRASCRERV